MRLAVLLLLANGAATAADNVLSDAERRDGWRLLFNGRDLDGWTWSIDKPPPEPSWTVENGMLRTAPDRGARVYLLTRESVEDFELAFEWNAEAGANSGIKYRFQGYWSDGRLTDEPGGRNRIEPVALEYQIADDERHPDALSDDTHSTAAVYEYWPARKPRRALAGVWHQGRIVARGKHVEHWLDGVRVAVLDLDTPEARSAFEHSRRARSSPILLRHQRRRSPIALQFHDGIVHFRTIKIRDLPQR